MKQPDVIIVGAGAAGLMAAYVLVKAGKTVTVLEARHRVGGRIYTVNSESLCQHIELGAEFIHGNLPVTLTLLKEADISYTQTSFEMLRHFDGKFEQGDEPVEGMDALLKKMDELHQDLPLYDFLKQHFPGEKYAPMRSQVEKYVNGYDAASIHDISTLAIRNEWENEDDDAQHRIVGGYGAMIQYLAGECLKSSSKILLDKVVSNIIWEKGAVKVSTSDNTIYKAAKVIIALPLGVLQAAGNTTGVVRFYPSLQEQTAAIQNIGFGAIIKILLEFKEPFWTGHDFFRPSNSSPSTKLLLTNEAIPTFWTQSDPNVPLLTGWLGGPPALEMQLQPPATIMQTTLASLGDIFGISSQTLQDKLITWHVANWTTEPYTRGSYAYDMVESKQARKILRKAVDQTIYFAGEYLYDGPAMGTVEAALSSGKEAAGMVLAE